MDHFQQIVQFNRRHEESLHVKDFLIEKMKEKLRNKK